MVVGVGEEDVDEDKKCRSFSFCSDTYVVVALGWKGGKIMGFFRREERSSGDSGSSWLMDVGVMSFV